jgi:hypothetical protein
MNLGQMTMVLGGIALLGILILNTNSTILDVTQTSRNSEFTITAVSLATSTIEEAMGTMFDEVIADSSTPTLTNPSQLSIVLGPDGLEHFRDTTAASHRFDDFDDFNNLFIVYKSDLPGDSASTPGSTAEIVVPGIKAKYFVKASVAYVSAANLDSVSATRTWHKRILVTVSSPSSSDTLRFPAVMSYWN